MRIYLWGNTDRQQFENDKQNVDVSLNGKISADAMNDRAFSLSFFRYFRAFTHYELFVSLRSLNSVSKWTESSRFLLLIHQNYQL